jgi:hypothetical protein
MIMDKLAHFQPPRLFFTPPQYTRELVAKYAMRSSTVSSFFSGARCAHWRNRFRGRVFDRTFGL